MIIDGLELTEEYVQRLLNELKEDRIKSRADLEHYLQGYWYTKDTVHKSHLLLSEHPKKKNFALPFE
jgi:hypothetical protein